MSRIVAAIVLLLLLVSAHAQSDGTFPLPPDMHLFESAADTPNSDRALLKTAIERTLRETEVTCETTARAAFAAVQIVRLPPQQFGRAAFLVRIDKSCLCGVTGNCPIFAYVRGATEFRKVLSDGGWGYSFVLSTDGRPAIVLASHISAVETRLVLWRFEKGQFVRQGCDAAFPKAGNWTALWNTEGMSVKSCVQAAHG